MGFHPKILHKIRAIIQVVQKVIIFLDNRAGQFKSKYTVLNICFLEQHFAITVS